MSASASRQLFALVGAVAANLVLLAGAGAQAPRDDALGRARALHEVAAQKAEVEARDALLEAQRLAASDPVRAVERLKKALAQLEAEASLPQGRKDRLARMLKDRIRVTELGADRDAERAIARSEKQLIAEGRRQAEERQAAEQKEVNNLLSGIRAARKEGKTAEANKLSEELARRFGGNPAAQASDRIASAAGQEADDRKDRRNRERGLAGAFREVERSAVPANGDVEFPKDWRKRTAKRTNQVPLTAKERAIVQALNTPITVNFKESRFEDVIEYLQTMTRQTILLDKNALNDAGVTYDSPVSANVKNVTVRTLLRKVLAEHGLTYVIKDEAVQVVSAQQASRMLVTRSYYIGDLAVGLGLPGGAVVWGAAADQVQSLQTAQAFVELIKNSIDPQSWQENGGGGTITFHLPTMSLIIRQSTEVHAMIGTALR